MAYVEPQVELDALDEQRSVEVLLGHHALDLGTVVEGFGHEDAAALIRNRVRVRVTVRVRVRGKFRGRVRVRVSAWQPASGLRMIVGFRFWEEAQVRRPSSSPGQG